MTTGKKFGGRDRGRGSTNAFSLCLGAVPMLVSTNINACAGRAFKGSHCGV